MTIARRLAKLEGTLSPKAAVLIWLEEARTFPSLVAYATWLVEQPSEAHPLVRIPAQVEAAARQELRGQGREAIDRAVRRAVDQAVFLYALVVRIDAATDDVIRVGGLRLAALVFQMRELVARSALVEARQAGESDLSLSTAWREGRGSVTRLATGLRSHEAAVEPLQQRYLDGSPCLFADAARSGRGCTGESARLRGLAQDLISSREGDERPSNAVGAEPLREAVAARALVVELSETARCDALDLAGETGSALAVAARRLRPSG